MTDPDLPPAIPAATIILLREGADGAPETLMVQRTAHMAFAAGAWVWPGGRIDPADAAHPDAPADTVAAIRELIEEVGIAVGLEPLPRPATLAALQAGLLAGEPLLGLLAEHGLSLAPEACSRFARWAPNLNLKRRFDTWFLIARAPAGLPALVHQHSEVAASRWIAPAAMLEEIAAGRAHAIFPTLRNLERLAQASTIDAVFADAAAHPVETIVPWVEEEGGVKVLKIPEGRGYPVTSSPLATAFRGQH
ncbi:NUDIX domain-containing protein [Sphingomicrobium astaxanthinifaciens]|uniref:NUDIX domain-containing protein n=1 Tax=Sphingomicrobium astaxanthinifaciens TaxID=1227949 RepID=UPI001FCAA531|nr:NUDIX domain-containing protein [Sphingomicrobium astaxanthinifaciens]MCJ7421884.1 NUDIX domain-containing protein [Sphingomicrobium astaxanthinifaciens]